MKGGYILCIPMYPRSRWHAVDGVSVFVVVTRHKHVFELADIGIGGSGARIHSLYNEVSKGIHRGIDYNETTFCDTFNESA